MDGLPHLFVAHPEAPSPPHPPRTFAEDQVPVCPACASGERDRRGDGRKQVFFKHDGCKADLAKSLWSGRLRVQGDRPNQRPHAGLLKGSGGRVRRPIGCSDEGCGARVLFLQRFAGIFARR